MLEYFRHGIRVWARLIDKWSIAPVAVRFTVHTKNDNLEACGPAEISNHSVILNGPESAEDMQEVKMYDYTEALAQGCHYNVLF